MLRGRGTGRNEIGNAGRIDRKRHGAVREPSWWKSKKVDGSDHVLLGKGRDVLV